MEGEKQEDTVREGKGLGTDRRRETRKGGMETLRGEGEQVEIGREADGGKEERRDPETEVDTWRGV
jgi:hypothetical protein